MGVNSIRADNLLPLVLGIIILSKTEVNIFGQLLRVCSSGLILLIHGHFVTFVSRRPLTQQAWRMLLPVTTVTKKCNARKANVLSKPVIEKNF